MWYNIWLNQTYVSNTILRDFTLNFNVAYKGYFLYNLKGMFVFTPDYRIILNPPQASTSNLQINDQFLQKWAERKGYRHLGGRDDHSGDRWAGAAAAVGLNPTSVRYYQSRVRKQFLFVSYCTVLTYCLSMHHSISCCELSLLDFSE